MQCSEWSMESWSMLMATVLLHWVVYVVGRFGEKILLGQILLQGISKCLRKEMIRVQIQITTNKQNKWTCFKGFSKFGGKNASLFIDGLQCVWEVLQFQEKAKADWPHAPTCSNKTFDRQRIPFFLMDRQWILLIAEEWMKTLFFLFNKFKHICAYLPRGSG